jgi:nicotinamide-nucleotide amidase
VAVQEGAGSLRVSVVSVGSEVTSGDILDTNARDLARMFSERAARVTGHRAVPDDLEAIASALRAALSEADVVVVSGGLGPTADDITRDALALVAGRPLVTDEAVAESLRARYVQLGRPMPEENLRQARLPEGAEILPNPFGTAPGIALALPGGQRVFLLPGPPREMLPMAERVVERVAPDLAAVRRTLRVHGLGESQIDEWLADLMGDGNPSLRPYAKEVEVHLRLTARAARREEAEALADAVEEEVRRRLGPALYATRGESLEEVAVRALSERGESVAFAESLTAGMASARLARVPGASAVLKGGVVAYGDEAKRSLLGVRPDTLAEEGAVSARCAAEMAEGARDRLGATYAVSMTGWAGPAHGDTQPVGTVYYGVAGPDGVVAVVRHHLGQRDQVRRHAAQTAIDLVRRRCLGLYLPPTGRPEEAVRAATRSQGGA